MNDNGKILTANGIKRKFITNDGALEVLKGVDFELETSQTASIIGASGVGKSTLLHILGGLDKPSEGELQINGISLKGKSETDLAIFRNKNVGFIFQFHYLMSDFDALENVMIPMLVSGETKSEATGKAELLLDLVGLKDRMNHRPDQLSGGEQQRVAVARALANDPKLVMADEPSGNLDTDTGRMLHELFLKLNDEKKTAFIIATHNKELAEQCHHRYEMKDGKAVKIN